MSYSFLHLSTDFNSVLRKFHCNASWQQGFKKSGKMKKLLKRGELKDEASEVQFILASPPPNSIYFPPFLSVTESADFVVTNYGHHLQTG